MATFRVHAVTSSSVAAPAANRMAEKLAASMLPLRAMRQDRVRRKRDEREDRDEAVRIHQPDARHSRNGRRVQGQSAVCPRGYGLMFWFMWNTLAGSYFF
jgi:hypothetical protein